MCVVMWPSEYRLVCVWSCGPVDAFMRPCAVMLRCSVVFDHVYLSCSVFA